MNGLIAPRAFVETLKDLKDHAGTSLFSAAILALPIPLSTLAYAFIPGPVGTAAGLAFQLLGLLTVGVWLRALLIRATLSYATGGSPDVPEAFSMSMTGSAVLRLLGVNLMITLMYLAAAALFLLPAVGVVFATLGGSGGDLRALVTAQSAGTLVVAVLFGLGLFIPVSTIIFLRYTLARAVTVIEGRGVLQSLSRSREIMKGNWLDLAVLTLILIAVGAVISGVVNGPAIVAQMSVPQPAVGDPIPMFTDLLRRGVQSLPPALGVVTAISAYLTAIIGTVLTTTARANFLIGLKGREPFNASPEDAQRESDLSP